VEGEALRVGLMQVSGISSDLVREIVKSREDDGPFRSALDFLCRIKANKGVIENLVLAGAFDSTDPNRKALFWNLGRLAGIAASRRATVDAGRTYGQASLLNAERPFIDPKAYMGYSSENLPDFSAWEKFKHETSVLGFALPACHGVLPPGACARRDLGLARRIPSAKQGQVVRAAGLVVRPHRPPTKSGKTVVFLSLEDEYGLTDVTVFDNVYQKQGTVIFNNPALIVVGTISRRGDGVSVIAKSIESLGKRSSRK